MEPGINFFDTLNRCTIYEGKSNISINCANKGEANAIVDTLNQFGFTAKITQSKDKKYYNAEIPKEEELGIKLMKEISGQIQGNVNNIHIGNTNFNINLKQAMRVNSLLSNIEIKTTKNEKGQSSLQINKNDWNQVLRSPMNPIITRASPQGHTSVPGDNSIFGGSDHPRIPASLSDGTPMLTQNLAFQVKFTPKFGNFNGGRPPLDLNGKTRDETIQEAKDRQTADLQMLLKSNGIVQISELDTSMRNGAAGKLGQNAVEEGEFITFLPQNFKVQNKHFEPNVGLFLLVEHKGKQFVLGNLHIGFNTHPDLNSIVNKLNPRKGTEVILSGDMNKDPTKFATSNQNCSVTPEKNIKWGNNQSEWGKGSVDGTISYLL